MSKRKQRQSVNKQKLKEKRKLNDLSPKTPNQKKYFDAINNSTYTLVVGPPGTGKSLIALWHGLKLLEEQKVTKIVIVRPMVEVKNYGEAKLGSLPGDLHGKILSWVLGIFDNSELLVDPDYLQSLIYNGAIEFTPLALCRGRTFHNAFVIVEEAQNISTTEKGFIMILTRLGLDSKMVLNGDLAQQDMGRNSYSALEDAIKRFKNTSEFSIVELTKDDIQRNEAIKFIIDKYEEK